MEVLIFAPSLLGLEWQARQVLVLFMISGRTVTDNRKYHHQNSVV